MRKRVWTTSPWFLIFSLLMFAMAVITFRYDAAIASAELAVAVASAAVVIFFSVRFKKRVSRTVLSALKNVSELSQGYLERYKMPVVVAGKNGEIVWSNSRFKKQLCQGRNPANEQLSVFLMRELSEAVNSEGYEIDFDGHHYMVFCTSAEDNYVCYYIDTTDYNRIAKKYNETRKSVALVVFDNRDEFSNDSEEESARVLLALETKLLHYANQNNALFKSLPSNKYMIIFDKLELDRQIQEKFPILKEVRKISYNNREATISVGIGVDCDNLIESEQKARKALDMALGRGGDQVAVMRGDVFDFFGGVSSGIEKMSKVRSRVIATSISRVISEADRVLIMGHRFSDLDCVGAAVGLQPVIEGALKKNCRIVINKETSMAKSLIDYTESQSPGMFITPDEALRSVSAKTVLVIVDTHIPDYTESPDVLKKAKNIVVIDHHRKHINFIDNAVIFYHEPTASSASEMVAELVTYIGEDYVTRLQAEALLSGIMLDTKNFVIRTGVRTFEAAAFLRKKGADTVCTKELFASSLEIHKEKYKIVSNAEVVRGCAVAVSDSENADIRLIAAQAADELLSVENVLASFVIFNNGGAINISARSYGKMNVQLVMEALGGGGHQNMAAAQLKGETLDDTKIKLIDALARVYPE